MPWLLLKDLRILRRSPLLVGLLVLYPVVIATLIGFALSRGPDKPQVAFVNLVPDSATEIELGGETIDVTRQAGPLFRAIDPVRVDTREEAIAKVEDGEVLGAIVIPRTPPASSRPGSSRRRSRSSTTPTTRSRPATCATPSRHRCRTQTAR